MAGLCCSAALRAAASLCAVPPDGAGGEPSGKVGAQHQSTPRSLPLPSQGPPAAPMAALPPAPADPLSG